MKITPKLILFLLFFKIQGFACDCISTKLDEEIKFTDAIFSGKVLKVEDDTTTCFNGYCNGTIVTFKVSENFKNKAQEIVKIFTMKFGSGCGFPFEENKKYLVYAQKNDNTYNVSLCSRTNHLSNSKNDVAFLRKTLKHE